jgi:hypothetical protein
METHSTAQHRSVEANRRKRTREEGDTSSNAVPETKRSKEESTTLPMTAEDRERAAKAIRDEERRRIETQYLDLPPLPPRIPQPEYLVGGQKTYSKDDASTRFFSDCEMGRLPRVCDFAEAISPSQGDLQFGLEKAAQGFHIDIVRYLMEQRGAKLHTFVFERMNPMIPWAQNIFSSGNPKLLELISVFLNNGWHPNQVWKSGRFHSNVALHYPNCLRNVSILRLLLQHGADPTISRHAPSSLCFHYFPQEAPVLRKSGDVLEMAAKNGTREAIDLLLAYGVKLEYAKVLHILISKSPTVNLGQLPTRPVDPGRYETAKHLLSLGEDINGIKDVCVCQIYTYL